MRRDETIDEREARALLTRTWYAFFGRFGRLTSTQAAVIAPVVRGESTLVCAPTASGKTEALVAPLLERVLASPTRDGAEAVLPFVLVSPTRALCNDLFRRLRSPVGQCNATIGLKSGDSPSFNPDAPPTLLVTTPESLDSLLCRHPRVLSKMTALVLDEIHLVAGSGRGEQLRCLVARLKAMNEDLQVCGASATAAATDRLARNFLGPDAGVVNVRRALAGRGPDRLDRANQRQQDMEVEVVAVGGLQDVATDIRERYDDVRGQKWLVFANRRNDVEWLACAIEDLGALPHHGSLSKPERMHAEREFVRGKGGIFVATTTLEIGVDIGNIDRVLLLGPPPNVASMLQRVGRSNRRDRVIKVTAYCQDDFERLRMEHLVECAREERLFPESVPFRPGVVIQQALSLAFQNPDGWVSADALSSRLSRDATELYDSERLDRLLRELVSAGVMYADARGRYVPEEPAERLYQYGRIHTNIAPDPELDVVDETTGRVVGRAFIGSDEAATIAGDRQQSVLIGGKNRTISRFRDGKVFVESDGERGETRFIAREGPRYSFELCQDLARFSGREQGTMRLHPRSLEHFLGSTWSTLFASFLRTLGFGVRSCGPFMATLTSLPDQVPEDFGSFDAILESLQALVAQNFRTYAARLSPGPYAKWVADETNRLWVEEYLRPSALAAVLEETRIDT